MPLLQESLLEHLVSNLVVSLLTNRQDHCRIRAFANLASETLEESESLTELSIPLADHVWHRAHAKIPKRTWLTPAEPKVLRCMLPCTWLPPASRQLCRTWRTMRALNLRPFGTPLFNAFVKLSCCHLQIRRDTLS